MTKVIHAHSLFDLIDNTPGGLTEAELRQQAQADHGAGTQYTTCGGQPFTLDDIIEFFYGHSKVIVGEDGRMTLNRGQICSH